MLVTSSNQVGINPIINQRILAAALRPRRLLSLALLVAEQPKVGAVKRL